MTIPVGFDWSIPPRHRRVKGKRLKLHMRDVYDMTFCGRRRDCLREEQANGVEIWDNGSHICATTDRPGDVTCAKCIKEGAKS